MDTQHAEPEIHSVETVRRGYWCIYTVDRAYGGPEEGGWWYDRGSLLSAIASERRCIVHWNADDPAESWVDRYLEHQDDNKFLTDYKAKLEADGFGRFDSSQLGMSNPRHESLTCHWCDQIELYYPKEKPHYE